MRKLFTLLLMIPLVSLFFVSCKEETAEPARLLVANMAVTSPLINPATGQPLPTSLPSGGPAIDVRWDRSLLFNNVVYGAAGVSTGSPVTTINNPTAVTAAYSTVKSGAFGLNFANAGSAGQTIYNRITSMLPGKNYTAMAIDLTPFYKTLIMEDDLNPPPAGKVKVRFVHAIPQALAASLPRRDTVDIIGFGGSLGPAPVALFSTRTFGDAFTNKTLHQYALLDSGTYNIGARIAGTPGTSPATGLVGLFPNQRLVSGKIYTFVARIHFPTLLTSPIGLSIIVHN
jgi:hypothetical protein